MSNDINPSAPRIDLPQPTRVIEGSGNPRAEAIKPTLAEIKAPKPDQQEVRRQMQEAADQLNRQMASNKRDLSFSVDDKADKIVLTVKNASGEVVRQIPDETALRVAHNLVDAKGLLRDEKI